MNENIQLILNLAAALVIYKIISFYFGLYVADRRGNKEKSSAQTLAELQEIKVKLANTARKLEISEHSLLTTQAANKRLSDNMIDLEAEYTKAVTKK